MTNFPTPDEMAHAVLRDWMKGKEDNQMNATRDLCNTAVKLCLTGIQDAAVAAARMEMGAKWEPNQDVAPFILRAEGYLLAALEKLGRAKALIGEGSDEPACS
jgi:hypothetical protein